METEPIFEYMTRAAQLMWLLTYQGSQEDVGRLRAEMEVLLAQYSDILTPLDKSPPAILPWVIAGYGRPPVDVGEAPLDPVGPIDIAP